MSPVETIESETVLHAEPELLVPIAEYALRHGQSRRTIDRSIRAGRLETIKQHGRTYIVDNHDKTGIHQTGQDRHVSEGQIVPLSQTDWIRLGYLQAKSKSKTLWQTYAIVLTVLFVALLLASLWLFTQWRFLIGS